jgi:hypothetical protein
MDDLLRLSLWVTRDAFVAGILWLALACPSPLRAAGADKLLEGLNPLTVPVSVLHTHIERETTTVARTLSPQGRRVMHQSVNRFFNWAEGFCQGDAGCLRNQYYNYLAAIPNSVYRVGRWTVYNGVYALEWADEDLQGTDPERPFTWDLQLTWPRVDAAANPVQAHLALADSAYGALGARIPTRIFPRSTGISGRSAQYRTRTCSAPTRIGSRKFSHSTGSAFGRAERICPSGRSRLTGWTHCSRTGL